MNVSISVTRSLRRYPTPAAPASSGWGVFPQPDGSELIWHNGSNQRFTSETWLLLEEGRGLLIVTNVGVGLALAPMQQLAESIFTRSADEGATTS